MTLRAKVAVVSILVAGIAILGASGGKAGTSTPKGGTYEVTVDTIEGCSCPLFCTCYFGASADEHMCQANNVYKFRKGSHYGDVDLSDQIVWLNLDLGGDWHKNPGPGMPTEWAVVTFDKKTPPAQREAIGKILNTVFPVKWKKFSTREDSLTWHDDAKGAHATMASGMAEISLDKTATIRPDKNEPVVDQEPAVLVLDLQRGIRAGLFDAPLRRRRRQSQVLLRPSATASRSPGPRRATSRPREGRGA